MNSCRMSQTSCVTLPTRRSKVESGGYIDDSYWAATFDKMVEVIRFVVERGPAYGYSLKHPELMTGVQ